VNRVQESALRSWLTSSKGLSVKVASDTISRLRRSDKIEPLNEFEDAELYLTRLVSNPRAQVIPATSLSSMNRAVRLFYEFTHR